MDECQRELSAPEPSIARRIPSTLMGRAGRPMRPGFTRLFAPPPSRAVLVRHSARALPLAVLQGPVGRQAETQEALTLCYRGVEYDMGLAAARIRRRRGG